MNPRFLDWIWQIKGSLPLAPEQSSDEAFARLRPLFRETGTSHELNRDTLTFRKKDPASQDKMSIFDHGVLQVERGMAGSVLRYRLTSRALLFCFLAPLLFLAFAQLTIAIGELEKPSAEADSASGRNADDPKDEKADIPMNPIDKFLGAPAPESKKDKEKEKEKDKSKKEDNQHSPTPAYVFATIFAVLYVVGRILEDRLIKRLFRRKLQGA